MHLLIDRRRRRTEPAIFETLPGVRAHSNIRLRLLQGFWIVAVLFTVGLYIAALPTRYELIHTVCTTGVCAETQLSAEDIPALERIGMSMDFYAIQEVFWEVYFALVFWVVAFVLFLRRREDPAAIVISLTLATFGSVLSPNIEALAVSQPAWRYPALAVQGLAAFLIVIFPFVFPDGRFVPRWTVVLAILWAGWHLVRPLFVQTTPFVPDTAEMFAMIATLGTGVASQVYRFRRVSNSTQRQQTKWAMFGVSAMFVGLSSYVIAYAVIEGQHGMPRLLINILGVPLFLAFLSSLLPVSIGISVLRYRLWDIDLIINRALVYTALTGIITVTYIALVVLLGTAVELAYGGASDITIAISTLTVAAIFVPLRGRIQRTVDRRFYRQKYDTSQMLTAFASRLRDEVDLGRLTSDFLSLVDDALQPSHISFWIPEKGELQSTAGRSGTIQSRADMVEGSQTS